MRIGIPNYKYIILAVLIVAGVSIAGWAFAFYFDNTTKSAVSQKEAQNDSRTVTERPLELDHKKLILLLVCTGLIGFFSVRRRSNSLMRGQSKKLKIFAKDRRPEIKLRINLSPKNNLERQTCRLWDTGCAVR